VRGNARIGAILFGDTFKENGKYEFDGHEHVAHDRLNFSVYLTVTAKLFLSFSNCPRTEFLSKLSIIYAVVFLLTK